MEPHDFHQLASQLATSPLGTIKHWHDQGYFLMKGLGKVWAEFSLLTLAYNLRCVMMTLGMPHMLRALV